MHRRNVIVSTKNSELIKRLRSVFAKMDVEAHFLSLPLLVAIQDSRQFDLDLLVLDGTKENFAQLSETESKLTKDGFAKLFLVVTAEMLAQARFPSRLHYDFVVEGASDTELQLRLHQLLWPGEEASSADFIRVGAMTLNLATYQVKVDGVTLDLTYLEYALLAFLLTHPGRTYSRDALLRRVWGFDYYGGSRTVDVHVRRVRSKLGPELAQHLETVRGVGYLWNA
ncbi:MAG: response regulator transcription factor [Coriobacteriales bacterium]|jgi:DNA-binding response OmpR family regulator|nr:response regulator transcription factor [Coriobacteriales bacterium]